jgi:hypothetical protein
MLPMALLPIEPVALLCSWHGFVLSAWHTLLLAAQHHGRDEPALRTVRSIVAGRSKRTNERRRLELNAPA